MEQIRKESKYTLDEVLASLAKKRDCKIDVNTHRIEVLNSHSERKQNDLGNGSQGKLDFLTNYCGFIKSEVSKFTITSRNYQN